MRFILFALIIFVSELGLSQITCTQTHFPINDAMTWSNHSDICYGDWNYVEPCIWTWDGSPGVRRGYVDFDIQYVNSIVNSIVNSDINSMKMDLLNPFSTQWQGHMWINYHNIFNLCRTIEDWDESTITWDNQPNYSFSEMIQMGPIPTNGGVHTNDNITDIDVYNLLLDNTGVVESDYNGIAFIMTTENINNIYQCIGFASKEYVDSSYWPRLNISYTFPEPVVNYDESGIFSVENVDDIEIVFDDIEYHWEIQGNEFYGNSVNYLIDCQIPDSTFSLTIHITNNIGDECQYFMDSSIHLLEPVVVLQSAAEYCENDSEIQLQATPLGGTWSGNGITDSNGMFDPEIAGVGTHILNYSVTDCGGISTDISITVHPTPDVIDLTPSNPECYAEASGNITVDGNNLSDLSYQWSNGDTTQDIYQIPAGIYYLTVTNTHGCSLEAGPVELINPPEILLNPTVNNHNLCYGDENGSASIAASGGNGSFTYLWSNNQNTQTVNNLPAGVHYVSVTDGMGCSVDTSVAINQNAAIYTSILSISNVGCVGGSDGSVTIQAFGGDGNFSYLWNDGQNTNIATNLSAGDHSVTITDGNGCSKDTTIFIYENPELFALIPSISNVSCFGDNDGSVTASATGGDGNYSYLWSDGQDSSIAENLSAGDYTVTVTDGNGCTADSTISVNENPELIAMITSSVNVLCYGDASGSANVTANGGDGNYSYLWSDGQNTSIAENLIAGEYTVTVTDGNGCTSETSVVITNENPQIQVSFSTSDVSCFGGNDGTTTVTATGGSGIFTYNWSHGASGNSVSNLSAGEYHVTISDDYACSISTSVQIEEPNPINVNLSVDSVYCEFGESGYLYVTATGDNPPFSFLWSDGTANDSIEVNGEGWYFVTVYDNMGCMVTDSINILIPEFPYNLNIESNDITCFGMDNGSIEVSASGGFPPYYFEWQAPGNSNLIGNSLNQLSPGVYFLNSIDSVGCEIQAQVIIHEPSPMQSALSTTNPSCIGAENGEIIVETTGGTPPYYYQLNELNASLPYFHNLPEDNYAVHVIDSLGCELVQTVILVDNPIECIRIPNAFTPNNDDNNDTWIIENIDMFDHWIVKVFNRWGQIIYSGTPADDPWDGRTAGEKLVPTGSYIYTIQGHNLPENYCGIVSVVY
ncbi:MAG: gliding motility-associated C-terminal domain-containing protein [Bacteroidales bacterium]|jgi:gliding motility-associated-like protein|nr:gliding motility-associated C-terminal domain-containing protein [Bacteroidales bacterium]